MSEEKIAPTEDNPLNVEGFENKPICPVCQSYLESASSDYEYKRFNPDTRWFWCDTCQGHLGYHRMRRNWMIDPYDLESSAAFREFFQLA